jgi:hypothetical protein
MVKRKRKATNDDDKTIIAQARALFPQVTGTKNETLSLHLINQVIGTLWIDEGTSKDVQTQSIAAALAALEGIAPRTELESLLAVQMVATHSAAMECLRRAMIQNQTFEGREQNLKHAVKLLGTYTRQLEALDKHRGKGAQKITVEHVSVHAGGKAIVGNMAAGETSAPAGDQTVPALENNPGPAMPMVDVIDAPKRKTRKRVRSRRGE